LATTFVAAKNDISCSVEESQADDNNMMDVGGEEEEPKIMSDEFTYHEPKLDEISGGRSHKSVIRSLICVNL
jgi:hypothetical protein